ncbi:hypothetical protein PENSTE_c023G05429 [Penicillium steckii]|uniref:Uncharacterized protein n=1 Tax=Penicillium steckii TaxID=303698 RepID=A0A1V6SRW7_9EURO|nr:hypothetical protein PENSTE_c023G05429 [Penicillium steckii]
MSYLHRDKETATCSPGSILSNETHGDTFSCEGDNMPAHSVDGHELDRTTIDWGFWLVPEALSEDPYIFPIGGAVQPILERTNVPKTPVKTT